MTPTTFQSALRLSLLLAWPCLLPALAAEDALPLLTDEELSTPQQQALLQALTGDPYGHRAADHARAGCAMNVRPRALSANTRPYGGYWVGGGQAIKGYCPEAEDGTFGWDYFGLAFTKRIDLNWSRGERQQGGAGAYHTDRPRGEGLRALHPARATR